MRFGSYVLGSGSGMNRHDHQVTQGPSHDTNEEGADTAAVHTPSTSVLVVDLGCDEEFSSSSSEKALHYSLGQRGRALSIQQELNKGKGNQQQRIAWPT
ncbi:hypothetical protein AMTR_s00072p00138140 [Amborella trichopoda]|uniref:Uncharacterized protein n=1 Tax=Amborella trichopoda TaxID=13333 RepID=W1NTG7_AMBTC|nr:hypothetical protein AMTR_s00072p00138140 [Amborella trichopoda]